MPSIGGEILVSFQWLSGGVKIKRVIAAALSLPAIITSAIAQPAEVTRMFDCSAFTHVLWACLPPSDARDSADGMASAFMSEAIRLERGRHAADGQVQDAGNWDI